MNATELSQRLTDNAARVAEHLLPKGRKAGNAWKVGNISGEPGDSLSVCIKGDKVGGWQDFATQDKGDLLKLWMMTRGLSVVEAMKDAKGFLGIIDRVPERPARTYRRPERPSCQTPKGRVREWLNGRGIEDSTIEAFKVGEQLKGGKAYAVLPYLRDGELINAKYRNVDEKRDMRQEAGAEACLFGWQLIDPRQRVIAITEGELDAMTLHQAGIPALSVNQGAGNHQWIENDWERLERFSEIYVCFDDDEAGRKGAAEVVQRLGIERCKVVKFGAKDANQWLMDGAGGEDFHGALKDAKTLDPEELVSIADFFGQVKAMFYPAPDAPSFPRLLLGDLYRNEFEFRPAEVTDWSGYNGHGKSLMLNQILLGLMSQGERVCVYSGEMLPAQQAKRLVKQATGLDRPSVAYIDAVAEWVRDRMWLFNVTGTATIARLLEVFQYGAKRYGITHFVIDSLMMTDVPEDGPGAFSKQKEAMQKLASFAKEFKAHVHLVAHPRKAADEKKAPGKLDIAGSSKVTDIADNVFSVWSARREDGEPDDGKPDALLELHKQRNGEVQHKKFWTWFNPINQQYCSTVARRPVVFVQFSNDRAAITAAEEY